MGNLVGSVFFPGANAAAPSVDAIAAIPPHELGARSVMTTVVLDTTTSLCTTSSSHAMHWLVQLPPDRCQLSACDLVVVHFHGNSMGVLDALDEARHLYAGVTDRAALVVPEYPGYCGAPAWTGDCVVDAVRVGEATWTALVTDHAVAPRRIVLSGRSIGTGVAVQTATSATASPLALILVSPFASQRALARHHAGAWAAWLVGERMDTAAAVAGLRVPTLVHHGSDDRVVPFAHGRAVYEASPQAVLHELRGADHNNVFVNGFIQSRTTQFLAAIAAT
jgi:hypothetical protein